MFDQLHLLSPEYEVIISRTRLMQSDLTESKPIRIVGLACPIANGRDIAMWMGVQMDAGAYFNFPPSVRPQPLEISVQSFDQFSRYARLLAMAKPAFNQIKKHLACEKDGSKESKAIVFVSDRKQARLTALDFVTFTASDEDPYQFKNGALLG